VHRVGIFAERTIEATIAAGAFDELSGQERPLPVAMDREGRGHGTHLLKKAGLAPSWVESARDVKRPSSRL
jgi:hypothetical protein